MKSIEDAAALCEKENDPFYLDAFLIEAWLGHVALETAAEYADNKHAKDRALQTGQSWRGFLDLFGHAKDDEFHLVLQSVNRFCEYDDVQAEILCRAVIPLSFEHECFSDFIGSKALDAAKHPTEAVALLKHSMKRWCDWVDAIFHFNTHFHHHVLPESFDPDPEKRELAALGIIQRNFPKMDTFTHTWWEWHHRGAAERFKDSSKWQTIGKLAVAPLRTAPSDTDEVIIMLWPLVKRHNWTYRDLMTVAGRVLPAPNRYPLEREQDLAAYCSNVLGLRKQDCPPGKSSPDGRPPGHEVAHRLCQRETPSKSS
jgi:hypothetical protein